ncbi:TPA: hypothetical protein ACKONR_000406 [Clostridioides difficile]|uniref:hypothetical protein n=1 Tax=Clostridioides difficile TaxID=1496 RepID=UPI000825AF14|nr:hypothetical protein [Clostridioides difficile]MDV9854125.1 hypothetical protein [Clostridioides difficile]TGA17821.1 hypothetical protein E5F39_12295 [Clostridioides difficile]TGA44236.1 hypothetical protein E5F32_20560 [Clostridioides difficile]HBE9726981.1 hypothetical protein [Clostridioides difficile]HBF1102456.1 hypothetical protein [Clostridioides difficile]
MNKKLQRLLISSVSSILFLGLSTIGAYAQSEYSDEDIRTKDSVYKKVEKEDPEYLKNLFKLDYLENEIPKVDLSKDDNLYPDINSSSSTFANPAIGWTIHSKTKVPGTYYGAWRNGPSGKGPATLSINNSSSINRSFTNTVSGSYPVGEGSLSTSLGVTIGKVKTYGTSYSIPIKANEKRMIIFRPRYTKYKVEQWYYAKGSFTGKTATAYVSVFSDWDYSSKAIK